MIKYLALILFLSYSVTDRAIPSNAAEREECDRLVMTIQTKPCESGKHNGSAEVTLKGAVEPVYFVFFYPNGRLVKNDHDVTSNKAENLSSGSYFCSVTDGLGCVKKSEFKID